MPAALLDVTRIEGMSDIQRRDGITRIGGAVTWSDIARADLPAAFDALKQAALEVGSVQIQNAGTIAGNLCNASPAADGIPPLLGLDAQVELASAENGVRLVPLVDFLLGVRKTDLAAGELLTAVVIKDPPAGTVSAFEKLGSRRYLVISICMTAATVSLGPNGRITSGRVAVGACSAVAQRMHRLEQSLIGIRPIDFDPEPELFSNLSPIDDIRGSADYRLAAVREQCKRVIQRLAPV